MQIENVKLIINKSLLNLLNLSGLVTFTCEHSTLRAFCQPPPHKNSETHTFFSTRLINNAYGSRRDNT